MNTPKVITQLNYKLEWIELDAACSYLRVGRKRFKEIVEQHQLTQSALGYRRFYKLKEINEVIEKGIFKRA